MSHQDKERRKVKYIGTNLYLDEFGYKEILILPYKRNRTKGQ